jgi:hypothetical protein
VDINSPSETIRENITFSAKESPGYYDLRQHKSMFDEGCSELLYQRKQDKLHMVTGSKSNE